MYEEVWGCSRGDYYGTVGYVSLVCFCFGPSGLLVMSYAVILCVNACGLTGNSVCLGVE